MKAEPQPTNDVNRDSGGWLRRFVRLDHLLEPRTHVRCFRCRETMWVQPDYYVKGYILLKCTCGHDAAIPKYDLDQTERA